MSRENSGKRFESLEELIAAIEDDDGVTDRGKWLQAYPEFVKEINDHFDNQDAIEQFLDETINVGVLDRPTDEDPLVGRTFGDYQILRKLGSGGMGRVYLARQQSLDRDVALKMIHRELLSRHSSIERFQQEARTVAKLSHPGVVAIYEVGQQDDQHFFAMEFVSGGTLGDHIKNEPPSRRDAARVVFQIADAVAQAHDTGVIHRDLKTSNILMTDVAAIKVSDFGLARILSDDSDLTLSGDVVGTANYMSPEQAAGETDKIGLATDVFSLGVILYELVSGQRPFSKQDRSSTLRAIIHDEPTPLRSIVPRIEKDLNTICQRCLAKDPSRRFAHAGELRDDLGRFIDGMPIHARPVGRAERAGMWARRNPWLALSTIVSSLAASAAVVAVVVSSLVVNVANQRVDEFSEEKDRATEQSQIETIRRLQDSARADFENLELDTGLLRLGLALKESESSDLPDLEQEIRLEIASWFGFLPELQAMLDAIPLTNSTWSSISCSPDLHYSVLREEQGGRLLLWDAFNRQIIAELPDGTDAAFSQDGRVVALSDSSTIRLVDTQSGLVRGKPIDFPLHAGRPALGIIETSPSIKRTRFSPDSRRVFAISDAGVACGWNVADLSSVGPPMVHAKRLGLAGGPEIPTAVGREWIGAKGEKRFAITEDGTGLLWNVTRGETIGELFTTATEFVDAAFVNDSHDLVTFELSDHSRGATYLAKAWSCTTGARNGESVSHVLKDAFGSNASGQFVLTHPSDATFQVIDVLTGDPLGQQLTSNISTFVTRNLARISADGRYVLLPQNANGTIGTLVDVETGRPSGISMLPGTATFSQSGKLLFAETAHARGRAWVVYECRSGRRVVTPVRYPSPLMTLAAPPRFAANDAFIQLFFESEDETTRQFIWRFPDEGGRGATLDVVEDSARAMLSADGRRTVCWLPRNQRVTLVEHVGSDSTKTAFELHEGVSHLLTTPKGDRIVVLTISNRLECYLTDSQEKLWAIPSRPQKTLRIHSDATGSFLLEEPEVSSAFQPERELINSSLESARATIAVLRLQAKTEDEKNRLDAALKQVEENANEELKQLEQLEGPEPSLVVRDIATGHVVSEPVEGTRGKLCLNGTAVAVLSPSSKDGDTVRMVDFRTGKMIGKPVRMHSPIKVSAIGSNDEVVAIPDSSGNVALWTRDDETDSTPALQHDSAATSICFSKDGDSIFIGCQDGTLCRWDVAKRQRQSQQTHSSRPIHRLELSSDSSFLVSSHHASDFRNLAVSSLATLTPRLWPSLQDVRFTEDSRHCVVASLSGTRTIPIVRYRMPRTIGGKADSVLERLELATGLVINRHDESTRAMSRYEWHSRTQHAFSEYPRWRRRF